MCRTLGAIRMSPLPSGLFLSNSPGKVRTSTHQVQNSQTQSLLCVLSCSLAFYEFWVTFGSPRRTVTGKRKAWKKSQGVKAFVPRHEDLSSTPSPLVKLDVAANVPLPLQGHSLPWCSSFLYSSLPCFPDNSGLTLIPFRSPWASKDSPKPCLCLSAPLKMAHSKYLAPLLHTPPETPQSAAWTHILLFTCVCCSHAYKCVCVHLYVECISQSVSTLLSDPSSLPRPGAHRFIVWLTAVPEIHLPTPHIHPQHWGSWHTLSHPAF